MYLLILVVKSEQVVSTGGFRGPIKALGGVRVGVDLFTTTKPAETRVLGAVLRQSDAVITALGEDEFGAV